jgi:hypothetical protein
MINHSRAGHLQNMLVPSNGSSRRSTEIPTVTDRVYMILSSLLFNTRCWLGKKRQNPMKTYCFLSGRVSWRWKMPTIFYTVV